MAGPDTALLVVDVQRNILKDKGGPEALASLERVVERIAGKHHAVDHQRVLARREQFRQPHPGRRAVGPLLPEQVVLWHYPARRQPPPGFSHRLHRTAQLDLLIKQQVPRGPVLGGLARKRDGHGPSEI